MKGSCCFGFGRQTGRDRNLAAGFDSNRGTRKNEIIRRAKTDFFFVK
jgi:hypothetical protein